MESRACLHGVRRWGWILVVLAPLVVAVGCGGSKLDTVPVSGKVTYQGSPVPWGEVKFQPVGQTTSRPGVAAIQADGSYSVGTLENAQGLVPGQYRVTVRVSKSTLFTPSAEQQAAAAKLPLPTPARYTNPKTSGLQLTINPGDGAQTFDIALTK